MQLQMGWIRGLCTAAVAMGSVAHAQVKAPQAPVAQQEPLSGWNVQITPYVWGSGMGGTVRPYAGGPTGHVDESLSDVMNDLDAAFFLNALVRKDRLVVHLDMTRASLSKAASLEVAPGATLYGSAKIKQSSWGILAGQRWQQSSKSSWDWLAGVRYWDLRVKVNASLPGLGSREENIEKSFAYPVAAARWRYHWDERWSTLAYLDAGGLGAGKYTWQTLLTVNYEMQKQWYLSMGYRYLSVQHDERGARLDLSQQGPVLGVTYRF